MPAMNCQFCKKEVESINEAIDLGWCPDYWAGEVNYHGPVCPECSLTYLETGKDGEHVLKQGCAVPPEAVPSVEIEPPQLYNAQKFSSGTIIATPEALKTVEDAGQTPEFFLDRHVQGDWGEGNAQANEEALASGSQIISAYRTLQSVCVWVLTEPVNAQGKRTLTVILLPEQY